MPRILQSYKYREPQAAGEAVRILSSRKAEAPAGGTDSAPGVRRKTVKIPAKYYDLLKKGGR